MPFRATLACLALLGSVSACSAGPVLDSGQAVADELGCVGWSNSSTDILMTEGGPCRVNGVRVDVYYFADTDARDSYVGMGSDFGGLYLVGDSWAVDGDRATLERLQAEHGGDLSG